LNGEPCYTECSQLPGNVKHLLIATPVSQTEEVVAKAISKGINNILIQQMAESAAAIELAEKMELTL